MDSNPKAETFMMTNLDRQINFLYTGAFKPCQVRLY